MPVPSGWRKIGEVAEPIALLTSMLIVTVVSLPPSETMKSNACWPTSAASGVHRNTPAPLGDTVIIARSSRPVRSAAWKS